MDNTVGVTRDLVRSRYFDYLESLVMPVPDAIRNPLKHATDVVAPDNTYRILFRVLFETEFYWTLERDSNRAGDAYAMREAFIKERLPEFADMSYNELGMDGPITFLEMVIALCQRVERDITYNQYSARDLFWSIMANLKLIWFFDGNIADEDVNYTKGALTTVMDREYGRNGDGGMFPLKSSAKDQRTVEIWYQANAWLVENNII